MQLPELGSVNFKICIKITGNSFPLCEILSTLSQKDLFPCWFSAPPPPRLLVPPSVLLFPTFVWISSVLSSCSCDRERMHQSSLPILLSSDVTSPAAEQSWFPADFPFPNMVCLGSIQLSGCMNWYCWPVSKGCWFTCPQISKTASSSPDLEQNTNVWLKPQFISSWGESGLCAGAHCGLCETEGQKLPPPSQACSHEGLQAMWEQTGCCWSSSLLLSLALGSCHHYSSQEEPNMMLVCNNLPSQCCRPVTSGGDAFRLAL